MQAAKNGFYYVLDRASGELLSAHNFAFVSWTPASTQKTGRPVVDPSASYDQGPALLFPSEAGASQLAAHGVRRQAAQSPSFR